MKKLFFTLSLSVSFFCLSAQQETASLLKRFLQDEAIRNASVSICMTDLKSGEMLIAVNPDMCLVPASVQKLVISAAGLEILGPSFQFKTFVWVNGEILNGKLKGDLIISGGGDPTLGSDYFSKTGNQSTFLSEWAYLIKKAGIDTITGNIVADPFYFSDQEVPPTWLWEDIGNYYGAAATGINVYDNTFKILFHTSEKAGEPAIIEKTVPVIPELDLRTQVLSSTDQSDRTTIFGKPDEPLRLIKGTLPTGASNYTIRASVPDPALLLAYELKRTLADSLIVVLGNIEKQKVLEQTEIETEKILVLWISPPLYKIVEKLNQESSNLYAETLLKQIALTRSGDGSTENGITVLKEFWNTKGFNPDSLFLADGSGLSRLNALSAATLVNVLRYMYHQSSHYDFYLQSIPLTGVEGTQQYYFQQSFLKGKFRAKSGSMTRVRSFAGYMKTQKGTEIAFAIIVNNYHCRSFAMASKMEKLLEEVFWNF